MLLIGITLLLLGGCVSGAPQTTKAFSFDFLMPEVQPKQPDTYLCHGLDAGDEDVYITEFLPKANKDVAHHILLYGCEEPGSTDVVWNCGEMAETKSQYETASVCARGSQILYAWAMDAPKLKLPKDVGFKVGGKTGVNSLVLQVHYKNVSSFLEPANKKDSSGLILTMTYKPQPRRAGVYLMVTGGRIPAHSIEYLEAACDFPDSDLEIHPFAFRTHAHKLGRVISGYRVRHQQWQEIGRQDPRKPQMFYNVTDPEMTIKNGDILAARCTMENTNNNSVSVGPTQNDEMCNFYIMYYVDGDHLLQPNVCFKQGAPGWYWQDYPDQRGLNLAAVPATASVVPDSGRALEKTTQDGDTDTDTDGQDMDGENVDEGPEDSEEEALDDLLDQAVANMEPDEVEQLVAEALAAQDMRPDLADPRQNRLAWLNSRLYDDSY
ncbi:hypothetical protein BaRGS_00007014 [Batillaria attramentaria]|uniref:peptidylglycine monooxygenase n=1 Tax=Batillaria attramentaria TaxID=370345 RepID=A0ABD0LQR7_9CAEN